MPEAPPKPVDLSPPDLKGATEALVRAFQDDPAAKWFVPDDEKRERVNRWYFGLMLRYGLSRGVVHTTPGEAGGAAIWLPPDEPHPSTIGMLRAGLWQMPFRTSPPIIGRFLQGMSLMDKMHRSDPPHRHWYLAVLGVDSGRQGQGIGGALISNVLERADKDDLSCYLETAKEINVKFYRKHGFDVVKEVNLPNDGPPLWTMLRQPVR